VNDPVDDPVNDRRNDASARAAKAILTGVSCFLVGVMLVFSPLVWGPRFTYNKYFVVLGLILALLGASLLLNGGFDWIRARRHR
jgi:hypothetical protein